MIIKCKTCHKKLVYRVGEYSADKFLSDEQKEEIKDKLWDSYINLIPYCKG